MVFNLSSKKKNNSKPSRNSTAKARIYLSSQRDASNVMLQPSTPQQQPEQPQDFLDGSLCRQLSSNRAIFESNKLESACSFLKYLKEKLEKDVEEKLDERVVPNDSIRASETITCILDTLIDVSDSITPIVSDVSATNKSDSSTISENHFNKTMMATSKLLELSKRTGKPLNVTDVTSYFAHTIVANNLEELSMFKESIKSIGGKIYVDKKLLDQLVELHTLLKDTIVKLKIEEQKFLVDPEVRTVIEESRSAEISSTPLLSSFQPPAMSTPKQSDTISSNRSGNSKIPTRYSRTYATPATSLFGDDTDKKSFHSTMPSAFITAETSLGQAPNISGATTTGAPLEGKTSDSSILRVGKMNKRRIKSSKKELKKAKVLSVEKMPSLPPDSTMDSSLRIQEPLIPTIEVSSHMAPEFAKDPEFINKEEPGTPSQVKFEIPPGKQKKGVFPLPPVTGMFSDKYSSDKSIGVPSSGFLYPATKKASTKQVAVSCCGEKPQVANDGTMTQNNIFSESRATSTFNETSKPKSVGVGSILKQTSFSDTDKDTTKNDIGTRTSQQTQTLLSQLAATIDRWYPKQPPPIGKIKCKECMLRRELSIKLKQEQEHTFPAGTTSFSSRKSNISSSERYASVEMTRPSEKSTTYDMSMVNKRSPSYFEGLSKCIAELDCMSNCLKHAAESKENVHECIAIVPEGDQFLSDTGLPHFHTVVDGVPIVIQFTKRAIPIDNSLRDAGVGCCRKNCAVATVTDASTCCRDKNPETRSFLPCRLWGSKAANEGSAKNRAPSKWNKSTVGDAKSPEKGDHGICGKITPLKNKLPCFAQKNPQPQKYCHPCTPVANVMLGTLVTTNATESRPSIPYVAAKSSLPKLEDPNKICSSLEFDVTTIPVTLRNHELDHPDGNVRRALDEFTVNQLLDSFRPARCCRKTVLNGKQHSTLPYAASLRSLPLHEGDLQTIHKTIMQSKVRPSLTAQTLFEYCVNFQNGISSRKSNNELNHHRQLNYPTQVFEVRFFELFKKDGEGKPGRRQQNNPPNPTNPNDMRILDFIKKIYTSEPIYDQKVSKNNRPSAKSEDCDRHVSKSEISANEKGKVREKPKEKRSDKKEKHSSSSKHHRSKYKKTTETKSYYTAVESYSTISKSNQIYSNSSASSVVSNKYAARSRVSSDSTMYSFLLIPKSEIDIEPSCNDLSASYAPSVNSLPFEDEIQATTSNYTTQSTLPVSRPSSDECDDEPLSPKNYAKTLDGIYELDENGNMRPKDSLTGARSEEISSKNSISDESHYNLSPSARNLSTIYESDERGANRDSSSIINYPSSKSFNIVRSRSVSPKSSVTIRISANRSRIPVSIQSYSASTLCNDKVHSVNRLSQTQNVSFRTTNSAKNNAISSAPTSSANSKIELRPRASSTPSRKANSTNISQSKNYDRENYREFNNLSVPKESGPRVVVRQSDTMPPIRKSVQLQRDPEVSDNLELPITFEVIRPYKKRSRNMKMDNNVMSLDIESASTTSGIKGRKRLQCYRTENMCAWPQTQKRCETSNKAFFLSIHRSRHDITENTPSQVRVLQQYPTKATVSRISHRNDKIGRLTMENFVIGTIGNVDNAIHKSKSLPTKIPRTSSKTAKEPRRKKKVRHIRPEVIDIKVPKDIKSTKLKHKFFKNGDRPGYVTILSPPCNCPDITIFLPCFCGHDDNCNVFRSCHSRDAQQYTMIPIAEKESLK